METEEYGRRTVKEILNFQDFLKYKKKTEKDRKDEFVMFFGPHVEKLKAGIVSKSMTKFTKEIYDKKEN